MQAPLLTLDLAFVLGFIHALDPSHGKPAVMAYLVGKKRCAWHSFTLAIVSAVSHSVSIFAIAIVTHWATHAVATEPGTGEHIASWLAVGSGWAMVAIGGVLLFQAIGIKGQERHCCTHHANTENNPRPDSFKMTAILGITTGLIPCPMALTAILATLSQGDFSAGLAATLAFALGITLSLAGLGIGLSFASRRISQAFSHRLANLPWPMIRALLILGIGIFYVANGLAPDHDHHSHAH